MLTAVVLLSAGPLAGAFGYGAVNLGPTFDAVPLETRLSFHAELMKMNSPVMQTAMTLTALSALVLALLHRGRERLLAAGATLLALASFLFTRFGNVPINADIKRWAVPSAPADHAEILRRWDLYNNLRPLVDPEVDSGGAVPGVAVGQDVFGLQADVLGLRCRPALEAGEDVGQIESAAFQQRLRDQNGHLRVVSCLAGVPAATTAHLATGTGRGNPHGKRAPGTELEGAAQGVTHR